jgi:hypothetical protein
MADDDVIDAWDLPQYITGKVIENKQRLINLDINGELATFDDYEKAIIEVALRKYKSFNAAGKALGITHKTVAAKARRVWCCGVKLNKIKGLKNVFHNKPIYDKQDTPDQAKVKYFNLSEQLGYDAHEIKWVVAKNSDTVKNLLKFIDSISCDSQEISANSASGSDDN